jgi:hypothetical protein
MKVIDYFGKKIKVLDTKRHYKDEVVAVLTRAAELFDEVGWVKGEECGPGGKVCAVGAIALAAGTPIRKYGSGNNTYGTFDYGREAVSTRLLRRKAVAAANLMAPRHDYEITSFNDAERRRRGDVQARLLETAAKVADGTITTQMSSTMEAVWFEEKRSMLPIVTATMGGRTEKG